MSTALIIALSPALVPSPLFEPTPKAAKRVIEFFTAQVNNDHTRKAYLNATRRFAAWCEANGIGKLAAVQPFHVAAFVKELQGQFTPPTVKQHLAALRMRRRQVFRLPRGPEQDGATRLQSKRRGQPSNNRLPVEVRTLALSIVRERYADFGPTPAAEKLAAHHGCSISRACTTPH